MKRLKLFILIVVSCLTVCLAFSGCMSDGAHYVRGSTTCARNLYGSGYRYDVTFDVEFYQEGGYSVYYIIYALDEDGEECYTSSPKYKYFDISEEDGEWVKTISDYISYNKNLDEANIKIRNLNIIKTRSDKDLSGIGIGFGVVAGVVIAGLITLFVLEKKKSK